MPFNYRLPAKPSPTGTDPAPHVPADHARAADTLAHRYRAASWLCHVQPTLDETAVPVLRLLVKDLKAARRELRDEGRAVYVWEGYPVLVRVAERVA